MAVITLLFVAEIQFNQAKRLEENYRWQRAEAKYQTAIRFNPFNAEYFVVVGNFMFRQSESRKDEDKILWLKKAEKLYQMATQLNQRYAEYWLLLAGIQIRLDNDRLKELINNYRETINKDLYNLRNNYLVGINMLRAWDSLDEAQRVFTLNRLRYILRSKPQYGGSIYPAIIYHTKDFDFALDVTPQTILGYEKLYSFIERDNLWQYRKQVKTSLDAYKQEEQPEKFRQEKQEKIKFLLKLRSLTAAHPEIRWFGKSKGGRRDYKEGALYSEETVYTLISLPDDEAVVKIQAKGDQAEDIWPYMIVELDGEEIGETYVDSPNWREYSFLIDSDGGTKVLSVSFVNDAWDKNEDRNLYVGEISIVGICELK